MKEKVFRICAERGKPLPPIPLRVIAPFEHIALPYRQGTLQELNARGGLTPKEALVVLRELREHDYSKRLRKEYARIQRLTQMEADAELRALVKERYRRMLQEEAEEEARKKCNHPGTRPEAVPRGMKKCTKCGMMIAAD